MGSVSRGRPIRDRRRWCCRVKNADGFVVARLSRALLHDDNAALFNSRRDIGQSHLRALARVAEVAFPAARLRVLFFVHSSAYYFFSDHRKGKHPTRPRLFFLRTRLRDRVLEHGTPSDHHRRALAPAFSPAQIFHSDFRRMRRRLSHWLRAGDLVEPDSLFPELAFPVFRKTRGRRTRGPIRLARMARHFLTRDAE